MAQFIQKPGGEPIELLKAINPATNKPFANLQEASDIGGFSPVAAPIVPSVVGIDETANLIDQGTDELRDEGTLLTNQINQLTQDAEEGIDTPDIDVSAEFEILKTQAANLGVISTAELTEIEAAGVAAGAEFDPLIAGARERARLGQAANIVAAGRRGGFFRTRFAGQAALGPTVGDVGFAGAGGVLERTESAFQRNIDALTAQKTRAIALAKAQARVAIRTGKQQDFIAAKSMLDFARQMDQDAKKAETDMFNKLFKLQQEARLEGAELRQKISTTFDIIKEIPEGTTITIEGFDFIGIAVPDAEKDFFSGSNIISLMGQLEAGTSKIIVDPNTNREYEIFGTKDPATVQAFDDQGNLSVIDKFSGKVIAKAEGVGKTKTQAASTTIILKGQEKEAKQIITDNLNTARDPTTGFTTKEFYISQFSQFLIDDLGDIGAFRASFPATLYLSPEEAKAVNEELAAAEAGLSALTKEEEDDKPLTILPEGVKPK